MSLNSNSLALMEQTTFNLSAPTASSFLPTIWGIRLWLDGDTLFSFVPTIDESSVAYPFEVLPTHIGISKIGNVLTLYSETIGNIITTINLTPTFYNNAYLENYKTGFANATQTFKTIVDGAILEAPAQVPVSNNQEYQGLGEDLPFNYGSYVQGLTILVFPDNSVIVGTELLDSDIKEAKYLVIGGTKTNSINLMGAIAISQAGLSDLIASA
jgi:hypothetical protein